MCAGSRPTGNPLEWERPECPGNRSRGKLSRGSWAVRDSPRSRAFAAARRRSTAPSIANWAAPQSFHHITPAGLAAVLEGGQDAVHGGEAALDPFRGDGAPGHHAVPVSSMPARAWARTVASGSRAGSSDQRPATVGGPVQGLGACGAGQGAVAAARHRAFGAVRRVPAVRPEPRSARIGASVSFVSRAGPGQVQTVSASWGSVASGWVVARTWSVIWRKNRP